MRKTTLSLIALAALPLAGCMGMSPGGGLGGAGVLGSVLGSVLNQPTYGRGGPDLQTMAVDACGGQAQRYGQVNISDVRAESRSTLRVYGTIDANYRRHAFACSYREDGRITDFTVQ